MYLTHAVIENSGPISQLDFQPSFHADGLPKPIVLVGVNGGGKTNFLSLVTDALFESAAVHFENVLPSRGMARSWFRVVGGRTKRIGTDGGYSLLEFQHNGGSLIYREKAGFVDPAVASQRVPAKFASHLNWPSDGSFKEFSMSDEQSKEIFMQEVHAYFPSSRSEVPFWLNREAIPEAEFDVFPGINKKLRKPIYVERCLHQFKQWVISVIVEARVDVEIVVSPKPDLRIVGNAGELLLTRMVLEACNNLLRKVMDDSSVRFVWLGRKSTEKLAVARGNDLILESLDSLSGGQSQLLGLFGTILRYGDYSQDGAMLDLQSIKGICLIDEIDAHIHVELQHKILPSLIRMFPGVQFIVSSHSPLFALGMEKEFGPDGFQMVEMPGGNVVTAETYSEFGKAMEALSATESFNEKLLSKASSPGIPIVFVEGETDTPYLQRAAELLGRENILQRCEIQWIGAKDENGQGFHTGKDALNHTLSVFKANPQLAKRPMLLLYDNDTNRADADFASISVRKMPTNGNNGRVKAGIENLLSESSILDSDYQTTETKKDNGDEIVRKTLRKADLCQRVCTHGSPSDFSAFGPALDIIEGFLNTSGPQS